MPIALNKPAPLNWNTTLLRRRRRIVLLIVVLVLVLVLLVPLVVVRVLVGIVKLVLLVGVTLLTLALCVLLSRRTTASSLTCSPSPNSQSPATRAHYDSFHCARPGSLSPGAHRLHGSTARSFLQARCPDCAPASGSKIEGETSALQVAKAETTVERQLLPYRPGRCRLSARWFHLPGC